MAATISQTICASPCKLVANCLLSLRSRPCAQYFSWLFPEIVPNLKHWRHNCCLGWRRGVEMSTSATVGVSLLLCLLLQAVSTIFCFRLEQRHSKEPKIYWSCTFCAHCQYSFINGHDKMHCIIYNKQSHNNIYKVKHTKDDFCLFWLFWLYEWQCVPVTMIFCFYRYEYNI